MPEELKCPSCSRPGLAAEDFYVLKNGRLDYWCIKCRNKNSRTWNNAHPERRKELARLKRNAERAAEGRQKWERKKKG